MCSGERTRPTLAEWHSGSPALAAPDREKGVMTPAEPTTWRAGGVGASAVPGVL